MDFICSISFVDLIISVLFSFVFLGLSLVGLFISFCYCTIILIKWIFKQINADSIHISLFFAAAAAAALVVALFVEHSEVAIVVMRHARMRNMLKGSCMGQRGTG